MPCDVKAVPSWATDVCYANDPHGQRIAMLHFAMTEHTTATERAASKAFVLGPTVPCTRCGKFAFHRPTLCWWCRRK